MAWKLTREELETLRGLAQVFVRASPVLRELIQSVQGARGRLYLWREADDLMARITPLAAGLRSMLLETPRGNSWTEHKRGPLESVLMLVERDCEGSFHGLGVLAEPDPPGAVPQVTLHRDLGIPLRVLTEPRYWYSMHRRPEIAEVSPARDRALVRFGSYGFHGTCLYALREGAWGCYVVRPSASESIADAQRWLEKRGWQAWG